MSTVVVNTEKGYRGICSDCTWDLPGSPTMAHEADARRQAAMVSTATIHEEQYCPGRPTQGMLL